MMQPQGGCRSVGRYRVDTFKMAPTPKPVTAAGTAPFSDKSQGHLDLGVLGKTAGHRQINRTATLVETIASRSQTGRQIDTVPQQEVIEID